jgi:hypothetical protein
MTLFASFPIPGNEASKSELLEVTRIYRHVVNVQDIERGRGTDFECFAYGMCDQYLSENNINHLSSNLPHNGIAPRSPYPNMGPLAPLERQWSQLEVCTNAQHLGGSK